MLSSSKCGDVESLRQVLNSHHESFEGKGLVLKIEILRTSFLINVYREVGKGSKEIYLSHILTHLLFLQ